MMEFIGVRNSWLMVARKLDLARLACLGMIARFLQLVLAFGQAPARGSSAR